MQGDGDSQSKMSPEAAVKVIAFFSGMSNNVRYMSERDELSVQGLSFREGLLVKECLVALGASAGKFSPGGVDDDTVVLSGAKSVVEQLDSAGVNFSGRASIPGQRIP